MASHTKQMQPANPTQKDKSDTESKGKKVSFKMAGHDETKEKNSSTNGVASSSDGESDESAETFDSPEEELLYLSRHGKETPLLKLLVENEEAAEGSKLNVNCKGNHKSNRGWTPLHLAAYFGQPGAVRLLLEFSADVNMLNACGESPLHLAAYTGREEVVGLLLKYGAETGILNRQGQKPKDVAKTKHIGDMLDAAENTASLRIESDFLQAAASGETEELERLLTQAHHLNINAQDGYKNSALHLAAMRGHGAVAVFLLQHGIDSNLRNSTGQTAFDLAMNPKIKQVLGLQPIKALQTQPPRFEGSMLKKSRFTGYKTMWIVLDRGVLSFFQSRGDASTGSKRKGMKYLDEAKVFNTKEHPTEIRIEYSDGSKHTLHLESLNGSQVNLQKWLNALQEHIEYSTHYIHQGEGIKDDTADDIVSIANMQDSLQNAQAHRKHLDKQIEILKESVGSIAQHLSQGAKAASGPTVTHGDLRIIESQASDILKSSQDMCQSLNRCMALLSQQEELRQIQLREEQERCRMLQDSLHALATEHHELERSLSRRQSILSSMEDEFFDCDDEEVYGSPVVDSFSDAVSQESEPDEAYHNKRGATSSYGRTSLPVPMFSRSDFSFWSILKQCIGKELSKITMPVVFNEPLSFIQRLAEYMEYAPLIEKAAKCEDPVERMECVAAFAVSALSSNWERIGKPFNPLLGETYELDRPDLGFRYIGEQVSHHPPITAFLAEGKAYNFHGSIQPKLRFWGKTVEISPKGVMTLDLQKFQETYTWQNVNCCIHNVIVGSLWVEHYGTMEITNNKNKVKAVLHFKQCGWFAKDLHHIEGFIYNDKKKVRALYGSWVMGLYSSSVEAYEKFMNDSDAKARQHAKVVSFEWAKRKPYKGVPWRLTAYTLGSTLCYTVMQTLSTDKAEQAKMSIMSYNYDLPGQKTLWKVNPRPPHSADYYHFSLFAMSLNELLPGMNESLPPTDSRFRPDIRNMEDGKIDESADEKNRVEEKQRDARKERKKKSGEWQPRWFTIQKNPSTGKEDWVFNNNYWKRNWKECADIF